MGVGIVIIEMCMESIKCYGRYIYSYHRFSFETVT
jgi:hypothetical protein